MHKNDYTDTVKVLEAQTESKEVVNYYCRVPIFLYFFIYYALLKDLNLKKLHKYQKGLLLHSIIGARKGG